MHAVAAQTDEAGLGLVPEICQWVRNFDLKAPGISGELKKVAAELKKLGRDDLASEIEMLEYVCFRIDVYRPGRAGRTWKREQRRPCRRNGRPSLQPHKIEERKIS